MYRRVGACVGSHWRSEHKVCPEGPNWQHEYRVGEADEARMLKKTTSGSGLAPSWRWR